MKKLTTALVLMVTLLPVLSGCGRVRYPHTTHSICRLRRIRPLRKTSEPQSRYGNSNLPII